MTRNYKQVFLSFKTLRQGNILGFLQWFYMIPISLSLFFTKVFFTIDLFTCFGVYFIIWGLISLSIHRNRFFLLNWTNSILIQFLDTEFGQKSIILGLSIEHDFRVGLIKDLENGTSVFTVCFFIITGGHLCFSLIFWSAVWPFTIWFNLLNVFYLIFFISWYRFRASFFNYATLTKYLDSTEVEKLNKTDWDNWDTFILLLNGYFTKGSKKIVISNRIH
jgi:hypothetical protein